MISVKLESFEGPFELLCHLIEKNEIDIYDIPIALLTKQYLEYIDFFKNTDMESLSEFLVMAATLIEIKSRMLLPSSKSEKEEEIDPRQELVNRLVEYKTYKELLPFFRQAQGEADYCFGKPDSKMIEAARTEEDIKFEDLLADVSIETLHQVFISCLNRKEGKVDKIRSSFNSVSKDLYTIKDKMSYIEDMLHLNKKLKFSQVFRNGSRKIEKVVTFLALLELIKLKKIKIAQEGNFSEIVISENIGEEEN